MEAPVLFDQKDSVAIITLNRPERRNAINQDLLIHLYKHLDTVIHDSSIRIAILTGAGNTFCSGLDLDRIGKDNLMDPLGDGTDLLDLVQACQKPIIGAINGHAITGGFEMALNCDFLIAAPHATFRDTHARLAIHPGWGMSQLLGQALGIRMARQISLSGEAISAQQALNLGLVNEIVEPEQLMDRVMDIAQSIAKAQAEFLPMYRNLINRGHGMAAADAMKLEKDGFTQFLRSAGVLK